LSFTSRYRELASLQKLKAQPGNSWLILVLPLLPLKGRLAGQIHIYIIRREGANQVRGKNNNNNTTAIILAHKLSANIEPQGSK
jgi:hypothetical protein